MTAAGRMVPRAPLAETAVTVATALPGHQIEKTSWVSVRADREMGETEDPEEGLVMEAREETEGQAEGLHSLLHKRH